MTEKASYSQILKSTSIMGAAAGINLLLGMVRTKFAAVFIGPLGVGMLANFTVLQGLVSTVAGLGIQSSAVREVAVAAASKDLQTIGRTVLSLRRISFLTGLMGAVLLAVLSPTLSQWTFGNEKYTLEIASLGLAIFLGNISGGQMALIQGMRRIGDLARVNVISAAGGTAAAISLYAWLGLRGIVPALLLAATMNLAVTWYFARRVPIPDTSMTWAESFRLARGMMRLGVTFMWTALLAAAVGLATNAFITQQISLEAVGIYTAAFALSGMFVNFILGTMEADYYPRLTSVSHDKEAMNLLVNEQTEIGLLLAVPALLVTLSLAPWIIRAFYTSDFLPSVPLLEWFVLGCLGRVIAWPMGFMLLALGKSSWFFLTQTLYNSVHMLFIWLGLVFYGIVGVSIAFFLLYIVGTGVNFIIVRRLTGFYWSGSVMKLARILVPVFFVTFILVRMLPLWSATILGAGISAVASIACFRLLIRRIGYEHRLTRLICRLPGLRVLFCARGHDG